MILSQYASGYKSFILKNILKTKYLNIKVIDTGKKL